MKLPSLKMGGMSLIGILLLAGLGIFCFPRGEKKDAVSVRETKPETRSGPAVKWVVSQPSQPSQAGNRVAVVEEEVVVSSAVPDGVMNLLGTPEWAGMRGAEYEKWGETHPLAAIDHARGNNPGASTACVSAVLAGWMKSHPKKALAWVTGQPGNAESSVWLNSVVSAWNAADLLHLSKPVADGAARPGGMNPVVAYSKRLLENDPSAAFDWIGHDLATPELVTVATEKVMKSWATEQTEVASGWLGKVPLDAPWRDAAIRGLVEAVAVYDLETAGQWAAVMQDEVQRETLLNRISQMKLSTTVSAP